MNTGRRGNVKVSRSAHSDMGDALTLSVVEYGEGDQPLVILHGLFGSARNWHSQARAFAAERKVLALDLRNHGSSPHASSMTYADMAGDVANCLAERSLSGVHLLGHSMGGKVAMQLALNNPELIDALIVVDIAPRHYPRHHDQVLDALNRLDLTGLDDRQSVASALAESIGDRSLVQFLLTNLYRDGSSFRWQINLQAITQDYDAIAAAPQSGTPFRKPTMFIKGEQSDYLRASDQPEIERLFPAASAKIMADAGHWPHVEKPRLFASIVATFLEQVASGAAGSVGER